MKRLAVVLALLASATLARAEDAATVYAKRCTVCHGKDGKGSPAGVKMGATDLAASTLSADEMAKIIAEGRGKMTAFKGRLTDAEIAEVAKYVKAGLK